MKLNIDKMLPIGLIMGGLSAGAKMIQAARQNKLANKIVVPDADYAVSPYAQNTLSLAKQMFNSRMPGMGIAERNIQANNANANAGIMRGATDANQALALMGAAQAQTDQSLTNLGMNEANYQMQAYNNVAGANAGMTSEMDKLFQDQVRKQTMRINEKNALRGAANENFGNGLNDLTSLAFMGQDYFGKKK